MLGIMPGEQYREKTVQLAPGDRLCFYTDGLVEARNEIGETSGPIVIGCLVDHGKIAQNQHLGNILDCQQTFRGTSSPSDDVTLVVAELMPARG